MKPILATARLLFIFAAWSILPFAAPLHGASPGFPFAEDFQFQSLLDSTGSQNAAQWTNNGVTLGRAKNRHSVALGSSPRNVKIGNSMEQEFPAFWGRVETTTMESRALPGISGLWP